MKTYTVYFTAETTGFITVEANSKSEAKAIAFDCYDEIDWVSEDVTDVEVIEK